MGVKWCEKVKAAEALDIPTGERSKGNMATSVGYSLYRIPSSNSVPRAAFLFLVSSSRNFI